MKNGVMNLSKKLNKHTRTQPDYLYIFYKWDIQLPQKLFSFQKIASKHMSTLLKTLTSKKSRPVSVPSGLNSPSDRDVILCHGERSFAKLEPPLAGKTSQ